MGLECISYTWNCRKEMIFTQMRSFLQFYVKVLRTNWVLSVLLTRGTAERRRFFKKGDPFCRSTFKYCIGSGSWVYCLHVELQNFKNLKNLKNLKNFKNFKNFKNLGSPKHLENHIGPHGVLNVLVTRGTAERRWVFNKWGPFISSTLKYCIPIGSWVYCLHVELQKGKDFLKHVILSAVLR